jgi:hypothetical protein
MHTLRTGSARKISEDGNGVLKKKQIFAERARAPIKEGVIISSKSNAKTKSPSLKFCTTAVTNLRFTLQQRGFSTYTVRICVYVCIYTYIEDVYVFVSAYAITRRSESYVKTKSPALKICMTAYDEYEAHGVILCLCI